MFLYIENISTNNRMLTYDYDRVHCNVCKDDAFFSHGTVFLCPVVKTFPWGDLMLLVFLREDTCGSIIIDKQIERVQRAIL